MSGPITESHVEIVALEWFEELGYEVLHGPDIGPDGTNPERARYGDVLLVGRLLAALARNNSHLPSEALEDALRKVQQVETPSLTEENRRLHRLLVDGIPVEYPRPDGSIAGDTAWLLDFEHPANNDWVAVNQFTVIESKHNRRPDVVVFVNGLPLGVIELKNPGDEGATIAGAFQQLQTYKQQIPGLFRTNAVLVTSDGLHARIGSLTADTERFMPWRTVNGLAVEEKGQPELGTLIRGVFDKSRFLSLVRGFIAFEDTGGRLIKKIAGYHQFHAVRHAVDCTVAASRPDGDKKVGVIWHTQGSGKSLLMAFYAGQVIRHPAMSNPTLVVLTDRNDLDDQLFGTFSACRDLLRQTPQQATDREHLQRLLAVPSGGVVFTTIQKFAPATGEERLPVLTDRRNVIVMADEAHRSQYGFDARIDRKTGAIGYGFAKHLRDALPNASFIGFTGTPIEAEDVNTPAVFGDYIDVYDIHRAVEDGATVPIYYESRLARIELDEAERPRIDAEIDEVTEDEETDDRERMKSRWSRVEVLVGAEKRLQMIARDLVEHFENRLVGMDGKGMVVCMSRRICIDLYNQIVKLRPDWHSDDDTVGTVKVVMTGSATDPLDWQPHIGNKARRELLAKRAKDPNDPLKLVIVRDMWLTGFDAPCLHTLYVDKPMRGHGLMQAIARVNRVFQNKAGGLIVDYIGLAENLKSALGQYSDQDRGQAGIDKEQAVDALLEQHEIVTAMFNGFDYQPGISGTPQQRLVTLAGAVEFVLEAQRQEVGLVVADMQREGADQKAIDAAVKQVHRRFPDAVLALTKAYSLSAASDAGKRLRDDVGFFQTIRAFLSKTSATKKSEAEKDFAIQQLVSRAVISTEIVDVLAAVGVEMPDISILSDAFLAEVRAMDKKNLAVEALRKLLNGQIRARLKSNVVQERAFTERLDEAMRRYHNNAVTTAQVLEELIKLAQEIRAAKQRGEELGLNADELAFYDALAENQSAVEVMGNDHLLVIAHEVLKAVRNNLSVDWTRSEAARARVRTQVRRVLRRYSFPPDLQDDAVKTVLAQAETMAAAWS